MLEVQDQFAIQRLIALYCYRLDQGRFGELSALFTHDGTWEAQYGSATGPADIERLLTELVPAKPARRHFVTNVVIDQTPGGAEATSYYMVVRDSDAGPMVSVAGTYHDRLVRTRDGEWRFAYRKLAPSIMGDLGLTR